MSPLPEDWRQGGSSPSDAAGMDASLLPELSSRDRSCMLALACGPQRTPDGQLGDPNPLPCNPDPKSK